MSFNNSIYCENKFQRLFESFSLPTENFNILLGFSGGADSTALLFLLNKFKDKYRYKLHAVHINHMIRGDEADRDEQFCRELCDGLSIPFYCLKIDVPEIARCSKIGLEEAARNVRYCEFKKLSDKLSPCYIATAHNSDDNVETVIFNLTRGTSLSGLSGIKSCRENIIRPILNLNKAEIIGYCKENGIKYITDSTNSDSSYSRNRIRNLVIPQLKQLNPSLDKVVARVSDNLDDINSYMTAQANDFLHEHSDNFGIDVIALNNIHTALQKFVLSVYIKKMSDITAEDVHIKDIIKLCSSNQAHSSIDIGGGYIAVIECGRLSVCKKSGRCAEEYDITLTHGVNHIPGAVIGVFDPNDSHNIADFKNIYKSSIQTPIKSDRIVGALRARSRMTGDVYSINRVNRKLKKVLNELEGDLYLRNSLPIICDDHNILWVPGARSATDTFPSNNEGSVLLIYSRLN